MKQIPLDPIDASYNYANEGCSQTNFSQNKFTKVWTFDLKTANTVVRGVPISGGTSVVKGNGTLFNKLIFLDNSSTNGDVLRTDQTDMYILE